MKSLNRVTLLGNLGADPTVKMMPSGAEIVTLSIATSDSYKNRQGEWVEKTDWHRVVCFGKLADVAQYYLKKGSKVYIEGKLKHRQYEKDGVTKYITDVNAVSLIMLDKKETGNYDGVSAYDDSVNVKKDVNEDINEDNEEIPF